MKALFLADNEPVLEMFKPIIDRLSCQSVVAKTDCKMITQEKPDVIVVAREETNPLERAIVGSGIPTLLVPHGMLMPEIAALWDRNKFGHHRLLFIQAYKKLLRGDSIWRLLKVGWYRMRNDFKERGVLSRYIGFAKIVAYGEAMKDILIRYNVKPENVVVTGNPKFDKYYGVSQNKNGYVLLLTEYLVEFGLWSMKQRERYVESVCRAVKECSLDLVVKIHPVLEHKEDYEGLAAKLSFKLCCQESLLELVSGCDMAVTLMSSAGLEAMVAGKPLIIYNPYDNPTPYKYGVLFARNLDELGLAVKRAKEGSESDGAKRFVYEQAYLQDGKAADRIAGLITKMAEGATTN